jgi:hypothetical protein
MSVLGRPGPFAAVLAGAALALHPAFSASRFVPGHAVVLAALLVLAALALVARALAAKEERMSAVVAAVGAVVVVAALAVDGVRGHAGSLTLAPGEGQSSFEEMGGDGARLGLRPLGFVVGAESVRAGGDVELAFSDRAAPVVLSPGRSVAVGGFRLAQPRIASPGGVASLRVSASDGERTTIVDVTPGEVARAGLLSFRLEQYFPDFALDAKRQPFSRSSEPRNPAALLTVEKGGQSYRVFVLQAMPGVHRVEALGLTFSLIDVTAERVAVVEVHQEPAAPGVLAGTLLLVMGQALSLRHSRSRAVHPLTPVLVAAAALALVLALVDRGAVLVWSFGLPTDGGRVPLAGVGVFFGGALVLSLAGTLLLLALRASGEGTPVVAPARAALWLAVGLGTAGTGLAAIRLVLLPVATRTWPLAAVALATALVAFALVATRPAPAPLLARVSPLVLPAAAVLALTLAFAAATAGLLRDGTYSTPVSAAAAAAALLGLAALEPTHLAVLRRFAFVLALLGLALA